MKKRWRFQLLAAGFILALLLSAVGCTASVPPDSSAPGEATVTEKAISTTNPSFSTAENNTTSETTGASSAATIEPSETGTRQTSVTTTTVTATTAAPSEDIRLQQQGFGFYGLDYMNNPDAFQRMLDSDYVNTFFLGRSHHTIDTLLNGLRRIDAAGKTAWLNISEAMYIYWGDRTELDANWQANLDLVMRRVEEEGLSRSVRGIYFDEPFLCKIDKASFIQVTKYFRETYPDKGVFACFSVTPIQPSLWKPDFPVVELDAESGRYLTDAAYDYYGDVRTQGAVFDSLTANLKRRLGREDVRIWYVPCTMNHCGQTDELYSIVHVQDLYRRLKKEKNPGGILCYTYYTFPLEVEALGNIGLDQLLAPTNPSRWNDLEYVLKNVGKDIVNQFFK